MSLVSCPVLLSDGPLVPKCRLVPFYRNRSSSDGESETWAAYAFPDNEIPINDLMLAGRWGTTILYKLKDKWFWGWEWYSYCDPNALHPGVKLGCNTCNEDGEHP